MAYKQKGWCPFTLKNDDKEPDIVIKYNKDGSRDMTEVREKIKKEERDSQITSQKNQKKSIDFNKLKPVGNKLDKNK